jgi:glutamyl-tRNA reductase
MTTDVTIPQGSTRAYLVYRRDGKPYPEAAVGVESIRMVTITAIDSRTEEVDVIVNGTASQKPTITISADGMTMTQVMSGRDAKGKGFTNTVVYDKQP